MANQKEAEGKVEEDRGAALAFRIAEILPEIFGEEAMTEEQKAAFINSQVACMLAELEAMKARNAWTQSLGLAQVYSEQDFLALPDKYVVGHNAVLEFLRS